MGEAKLGGMQCLAMKLQVFQYSTVGLSRTSVDRIAEQRVTDRGHVNPNLMRSAGFELAFDQRGVVEDVEPPPVSYRAFAARAFDDRDLLAVGRRAGERCIDYALACLGNAV